MVTINDYWTYHILALLQGQAKEYKNESDIPGPLFNAIKVMEERIRKCGAKKPE